MPYSNQYGDILGYKRMSSLNFSEGHYVLLHHMAAKVLTVTLTLCFAAPVVDCAHGLKGLRLRDNF